jgi:heptosyltransferase-2
LVIAPEGIGGAVLSLPALQLFRQENPDVEITVLAEAVLEPFWKMCPAISRFQCLESIAWGRRNRPKGERFDRAYLLRDDFRSALITWRAGIPRRIGFRGHRRRLLLTEIVHRPDGHRQFEFMNILGVQGEPPAPKMAVSRKHFHSLERKLIHFPNIGKNRSVIFQTLELDRPTGARPVIILMPGGPGERWSAAHFGLLAKNLASSLKAVILLTGDSADQALCAKVAAVAGPEAIDLAGKITLPEWAALLSASDCAVCNAGGGMHLAAVLGTPVVPVCGLSDPAKNYPLGKYTHFDEKTAPPAEPEFEEVTRTLTAVTTDRAYVAVAKIVSD